MSHERVITSTSDVQRLKMKRIHNNWLFQNKPSLRRQGFLLVLKKEGIWKAGGSFRLVNLEISRKFDLTVASEARNTQTKDFNSLKYVCWAIQVVNRSGELWGIC